MANWSQEELDAYYNKLKSAKDPSGHFTESFTVGGACESVMPPMASDSAGTYARKARSLVVGSHVMNKTEAAYAQELENQKRVGLIAWWAFEPFKLRLADRTTYSPDFGSVDIGGHVLLTEIKGFLRDDANVKFKVAAEMFPFFEFVMIRKQKGGGWGVMNRLNGRNDAQVAGKF